MGKLILVRHGESEGNAIRRFTISPEADITELGRRQAAEAAELIRARFKPDLLIASTYRRAHETGRIIAAHLGIPLELEHGFREQSFGELAGQPYEVVGEHPIDPAQPWLWRPPGGESQADVRERTAPLLDALAQKYADSEIVIVSHGGVMRSLWVHVTGQWENAHVPPNCGIVLIEHERGRYRPPVIVQGKVSAREAGG